MIPDPNRPSDDSVTAQEVEVLREYGLRWAVLASWRDALRLRHLEVPREVDHRLELARMKLASGCFSVCDVGCDLNAAEGALTSVDASSQHNWVDFWVGLLGQSMRDEPAVEFILKIPAVRSHYQNCGIKGCNCET
jgi:hypothetical protein